MKFADALAYLFCTALTLISCQLHALATFELILPDEANSGFFDNTPTTPVGGNSGTTRGEQRQIALNYALDILGQTLSSRVPIQISAQFQMIELDSNFIVIAAASPKVLLRDFTGAPQSNTWYPSALANQLAGQDLTQQVDIEAEFDPNIDSNLNDGISWYYGLDGLPASNELDFVTVALHELTHGLGFINVLDYSVANQIAGADLYDDRPDVFSHFFQQRNASPLALLDMNRAQRAAALTSNGNLQWVGSAGRFIGFGFQSGVNSGNIQFYAPSDYEQGSSASHTSNAVTPNDLMEPAYFGAIHDLGIGAAVLADIGWGNYTDVVVTALFPIEPISANTDYALQIKVVNNGVQDADDLILNYTLPSNTTLVTLTPPQGSCDTSIDPIRCDLGTLDKRATLTLTATVNSTAGSDLIHEVSVTANNVDSNIDNNITQLTGRFSADSVSISSDAGDDINTVTGQNISLGGSSNDNQASLLWTQLSGPSVSLNNTSNATPNFTAPEKSGVLLFKLTATNAEQHVATDTVSVSVNRVPVANAGSDQVVDINSSVTFNALESADDTEIVSYVWQQTAGIDVQLSNNNTAKPSFISPGNVSNLSFALTVTDDLGQSATDTLQVSIIDSNAVNDATVSPFSNNKSSGAFDIWWALLGGLMTQQRRCKKNIKPGFPL